MKDEGAAFGPSLSLHPFAFILHPSFRGGRRSG
jgi:hypothetical protein